MRAHPAVLAAACLLLAGCFQAADPGPPSPSAAPASPTPSGTTGGGGPVGSSDSPTGGGGQAGSGEETRDPDAPGGADVGKRPLQDVEANATGELGSVAMSVNNSMAQDAHVFIGFRPRSLVPEAPCNLLNLRVPALSRVEVSCRLNLLSDGLLVMGAEWFEAPNATVAMAVVRHTSEAGTGTDYRYEIQILPRTAMMVNRVH